MFGPRRGSKIPETKVMCLESLYVEVVAANRGGVAASTKCFSTLPDNFYWIEFDISREGISPQSNRDVDLL